MIVTAFTKKLGSGPPIYHFNKKELTYTQVVETILQDLKSSSLTAAYCYLPTFVLRFGTYGQYRKFYKFKNYPYLTLSLTLKQICFDHELPFHVV